MDRLLEPNWRRTGPGAVAAAAVDNDADVDAYTDAFADVDDGTDVL